MTLILNFFLAKNSFGARISLIRDAQTEKFLSELSEPIFRAANLDPENIKLYIVNDNSINAFVSGGQNVFINTGLIRKFSTPDALIGVMAHETGHIAAGHLARSSEGAEQATGALLLSYLLGIGAVVAGSPEAGMAIITGGSNSAQRLYMKYTRNQEEAADGHAIHYLDKIAYPASGLVSLLEFFDSQLVGYKDFIDEYLLSHPVSKKRINLIKNRTKNTKHTNRKINQKLQRSMDIVSAKLEAFIESPDVILKNYQNQHDELANYRKAIALFRIAQISQSLVLLEKIISTNESGKTSAAKTSELGFLYELKGQILFESGKIQDSILSYNKAINLLDKHDSSQAKIHLSVGILGLKTMDKDLLNLAIRHLEEAKTFESDNPFLFRQLAKAHAKIGNEGESLLSLAEFNFLINKKKECLKYAKLAKDKLPKNDKVNLLRADDLVELVKDDIKEKSRD